MNLNELIQSYRVSDSKELRLLQRRLSDVPIEVKDFKPKNSDWTYPLSELDHYAELYSPETRMFFFDECFKTLEESDEVSAKIRYPFSILWLSGENVDKNFHQKYRLKDVIVPLEGARLLTSLEKRDNKMGDTVGLIYGEGRKKDYLEIMLLNEFMNP